MATKRMFSLQIIDTDAFLDMPISSQVLYFHLVMRADDEGFIGNPKKITRLIGAQDDDMKILIAKRFLLSFESGIVVIKHWLIHNTIRMDRFNKTSYSKEKCGLEISDNKAYTEIGGEWQPVGNQLEPQVKLSKVKLSKVKLDTGSYSESFESFWKEYPEKVGKSKAFESWEKLSPTEKERSMVQLKLQVENNHFRNKSGIDYIPHPTTWLNQKRWEDEIKVEKKLEIIKFDKYGNVTK